MSLWSTWLLDLKKTQWAIAPLVRSQAFGVWCWNGAISPQLREKDRVRHSLVKVTPVQPYLGPVTFGESLRAGLSG